MAVQEIIEKLFGDFNEKWFDYPDYVKSNCEIERKGLSYRKRFGRFEIYIISDGGEEVLIDALQNDEEEKLTNILKMMLQ